MPPWKLTAFDKSRTSWRALSPLTRHSSLLKRRNSIALPFESASWDRIEAWGENVTAEYWRTHVDRVSDVARDGSRAIRMLLANTRPFAAFRVLEGCMLPLEDRETLDPILLLDVLRAMTAAAIGETENHESPDLGTGAGYQLGELLTHLESSQAIDDTELFRHEWAWYSLLARTPRGSTALHRTLARDPACFAMLIGLICRPPLSDTDDSPMQPLESHEHERATQARELLQEWHGIPGTDVTGAYEESLFLEWLIRARKVLAESGHSGVGDSQIGSILARLPSRDQVIWPSLGIQSWIQEQRSEALDNGFRIGSINSRGVTSRTMDAGGEQERNLVARFDDWALAAMHSPRVERILRRVADWYRDDAKSEDEARDLREYWP